MNWNPDWKSSNPIQQYPGYNIPYILAFKPRFLRKTNLGRDVVKRLKQNKIRFTDKVKLQNAMCRICDPFMQPFAVLLYH